MSETRVLELPDGRDVAWIEYGIHDGVPVVAFHGSPGTGQFLAPKSKTAAACSVRLIAVDRPGYGHSTCHPDRTYESWAADVGHLADHLGVEGFAVLGHSSGAPNAAACARFLGDRILGCAIVSSPAPPEGNIPNRAISPTLSVGQRVARVAPRLMGLALQAGLRQAQRQPDKALAWMLGALPACDAAVIEQADIQAAVRHDLTRPLASTAGRAAIQDLTLERRPWGFHLHDIAGPVHVWHGDLDRNVDVASGIFHATEITDAVLHRLPDQGHWLIYSYFEEIVQDLIPFAP